MIDLDKIINTFVTEEIALDQDDISSSVKSKEWLLDRIKTKIAEKSYGPQLYSENPFLGYGSYFARVKVKDVDEMDFLVVIDSNSGIFSKPAGTQYGVGLGSENPNHKYDVQFKKSDLSGVSPNKLLLWLQGICWEVLQPLGGERPTIDGPAVKVVLKGAGIRFDLVPSGIFERSDGTGNLFYNIPKGDPTDDWTLTNPTKDLDRVNGLAQKKDGFRNVIRLMKVIRDSYQLPISSYALQCVACQFAEGYQWQRNLYLNFHVGLMLLTKKLREGIIEDGFDTSINLLPSHDVAKKIAEVVETVNFHLNAIENESDEDAAYEKFWQIMKNTKEVRKRNSFLTEAIARRLYPTAQKNPWG